MEGGDRGLTGIGSFIVVLGRDIEGYGDAIGCFGDVWLLVSGDGFLQRREKVMQVRDRSPVISSGKIDSRTSRSSICSSRPMFPL